MADNFLERQREAYEQHKQSRKTTPARSVSSLLLKNRSYRGYDPRLVVSREQLKHIVAVNDKIPSARNQQILRFRLITTEEADLVLPLLRMGGALPELHLPLPGTEPRAFILIGSIRTPDKYVYMDLGISCQSMLLQAVEMGLNGLCIAAFDKEKIKALFQLAMEPLLLLAIGKGAEQICLTRITPTDSHKYYRSQGIHYVPKLGIEDLLV